MNDEELRRLTGGNVSRAWNPEFQKNIKAQRKQRGFLRAVAYALKILGGAW